jgi:molybdate transport system substrate-binding protein
LRKVTIAHTAPLHAMTFRTLPFLRRTACVGAALALTVAAPSAFAADLVVSAAASLTNAFKTLAEQYEHAHPDTKVVLNFGASDVLMQQIVKGAPADVFASADQTAMDKAEAEKVVQAASARICRQPGRADRAAGQQARHRLAQGPDPRRRQARGLRQSVVGAGGPLHQGRARSRGPLGCRGRQGRAGPERAPEPGLRGTRRSRRRLRVRHRCRVMPDKVKVAVRVPNRTPVTYPIAVTTQTKQAQQATSFVQYVLSAEGQAVLAKFGFQKP